MARQNSGFNLFDLQHAVFVNTFPSYTYGFHFVTLMALPGLDVDQNRTLKVQPSSNVTNVNSKYLKIFNSPSHSHQSFIRFFSYELLTSESLSALSTLLSNFKYDIFRSTFYAFEMRF